MPDMFVARIQILGSGPNGEETCNTFHYVTTSASVTSTTTGTLSDVFNSTMATAYAACIVPTWTWFKTHTEIFYYNDVPEAIYSFDDFQNNGLAGTNAGTCDAIERAVIVQKKTGLAGRFQRGRIFVPMPRTEVADVNGFIDFSFTPVYDDLGGAMLTPLTADGTWDPAVGHHFSSVTATRMIATGINGIIGIQKRRRARFLD